MIHELTLSTRAKLIALWGAVMFCYIYGDYFALYIPHEAEKLVRGDTLLNSPVRVFGASVLMCLPSLVILTTVFARAPIARWMNIIFGVVFTGIMLLIAATSFPVTPEIAAYFFYALLESAITIAIIWQAWKWPHITNAP
jgi:hypothetical protein